MTDAELDALEAVAKAATPGPWKHYNYKGSDCVTVSGKVFLPRLEISVADTAFIAAANPAAVLDLIAALRQARAERDWLARDIACSARKNWWAELTWKPEYWRELAAKEATCKN